MGLSWRRSRFCSRHDKAVTRWHYRRCKHYVLVLDEFLSGDLLRAGNQLYRIAAEAYRLSRNGDQVMSLGQRDTMFYALRRWERASGSAPKSPAAGETAATGRGG